MAILFDITLSGYNDIYLVDKNYLMCPGILKFSELRKSLIDALPDEERPRFSLENLAQTLRIPLEDIELLEKEGYLSGDASNKLTDYAKLLLRLKEFKDSQDGPLEDNISCSYRNKEVEI